MFDKNIYIERRKILKKSIGSGLVLFLGNEESPMNYEDNTYHFRQDSTFLYYFGIDIPGLTAIIDIDNDIETIYGDDFGIEDIIWRGPQPKIKDLAELVGVKETRRRHDISVPMVLARNENKKIHFLLPYRSEHQLKISDWLNIKWAQIQADVSTDFIKAVVSQRSIKGPEEIEEIEKAVNITADMHFRAMEIARPGMKESDLAAAVQEVAIRNGGQLSFPTIMTIHGETLHNHYHGNTISAGDLIINDSGAENAMHYAGDMSRTFPANKKFSNRQKEVYEIALAAHEAAIAALQPGVKYLDVHLAACRAIAEGMKDLNILKGNTDELVKLGVHTLFFQCGTGHMMGLDVHDMENFGEQYVGYRPGLEKSSEFGLKSLRLGKELEPGFVLTVEPGIYFIPQLIDQWEAEKKHFDFVNFDEVNKYRDFGGLRSEEDFLITKDGARLLGKPVAKTVGDIEEIRGNA